MLFRRYTLTIEDGTSGGSRRLSLSASPVVAVACAVVTLPVLVGLGAAWKARADVADLYVTRQALEVENSNYREATASLAGQIESLQAAVADLGARAALEPSLARAMDRLPALVKSRAMGGAPASRPDSDREHYAKTLAALARPDDTFGMLKGLLLALQSRLHVMDRYVERRNALAAATPSIWPATGWLTSTMGTREDPISGGANFHPGLDIAGRSGQPVHATAEGTVSRAGVENGYGNLIVIDHGFGLETYYGHLSSFSVKAGDHVNRGDLIGRVGATGRATGPHLHYEVRASGRLLNPLQLLTQQKPRDH